MLLVTIGLFFIYIFGFGYTFTRFIKENTIEVFILRIAVGLGFFPIFGILLNILHVSLDWKVFLVTAFFFPILDFIILSFKKEGKFIHFNFGWDKQVAALLAIFVCMTTIFAVGAFKYRWLEDDDPWFHAAGIKYISVEKNLDVEKGAFQYINPYPPGYDLLMGVLHQTSPSLQWTLKFFNLLIVSLALLFFYCFCKEFSGDRERAIISTFLLACIPCFLSHFIWAHSMAVALFFPVVWLLIKSDKEKEYILPAVIVICGASLTQPTQFIKFIVLIFIYLCVLKAISKKHNLNALISFVLAILVSFLVWWGPIIYKAMSGETTLVLQDKSNPTHLKSTDLNSSKNIVEIIKRQLDSKGGSGTKSYGLLDFISVPYPNSVNNPRGFGLAISLFLLLGLYSMRKTSKMDHSNQKVYRFTILYWLIFTFLGVNSYTFRLPIGLYAFRFWMLLAIPVVLIACEGILYLKRMTKYPSVTMYVCFALVFFTAAVPKIKTNINSWTPGAVWPSYEEMKGYMSLATNLKPNTKVYTFEGNHLLVGFDMSNEFWKKEFKEEFRDSFYFDSNQLRGLLNKWEYQYLIFGLKEKLMYGDNAFNKKLDDLENHTGFKKMFDYKDAVWVFKVL